MSSEIQSFEYFENKIQEIKSKFLKLKNDFPDIVNLSLPDDNSIFTNVESGTISIGKFGIILKSSKFTFSVTLERDLTYDSTNQYVRNITIKSTVYCPYDGDLKTKDFENNLKIRNIFYSLIKNYFGDIDTNFNAFILNDNKIEQKNNFVNTHKKLLTTELTAAGLKQVKYLRKGNDIPINVSIEIFDIAKQYDFVLYPLVISFRNKSYKVSFKYNSIRLLRI